MLDFFACIAAKALSVYSLMSRYSTLSLSCGTAIMISAIVVNVSTPRGASGCQEPGTTDMWGHSRTSSGFTHRQQCVRDENHSWRVELGWHETVHEQCSLLSLSIFVFGSARDWPGSPRMARTLNVRWGIIFAGGICVAHGLPDRHCGKSGQNLGLRGGDTNR